MLNLVQKFFKPKPKLDEINRVYLSNKDHLTKQRECFHTFLINYLQDVQFEILEKLNAENLVCISVPEAYGFSCFVNHLRFEHQKNFGYKSIQIKATPKIKEATQLAIILLKEWGHKVGPEPLEQLKKYSLSHRLLVVVDQIQFLADTELKNLLENLISARVILIGPSESSFKSNSSSGEIIEIPLLTNEKAIELALSLLNFRSDLILTSADRQELVNLVNICGRLPEVIYTALASPQGKNNLAVEKYCKLILAIKLRSTGSQFYHLLAYYLSELPEEVKQLLAVAYHLPSTGFTLNDLYVLCRDVAVSKSELNTFLQFLTHIFFVQKSQEHLFRDSSLLSKEESKKKNRKKEIANTSPENDVPPSSKGISEVYFLPEFVRRFIRENIIEENNKETLDLIRRANLQLIQRLESNLLWQEPIIWVTQFEHSLYTIQWINESKAFNANKYLVLFIQSIYAELGFWREIEESLIPLCSLAIRQSDNNEDRGFWYSLTGLMYKSLSQFKNTEQNLQTALNYFQKSLKFYDPTKQQKRYSFLYQNIGQIFYELALPSSKASQEESTEKSQVYLKQAIKAFYKALGDEKELSDKSQFVLKRLLAQTFIALAKQDKPGENCFKAFGLYTTLLKQFQSLPANESRQKLIFIELDKLSKLVSQLESKANDIEKNQLSYLNKQIDEFVLDKVE
ncbi:MAG: hypothetical protein SFU25_03075 [Candidatus Caenarcaniphilales bacterium]|nr:hypothetical protein [Candidatus Caenarcaniphilales bacterium]